MDNNPLYCVCKQVIYGIQKAQALNKQSAKTLIKLGLLCAVFLMLSLWTIVHCLSTVKDKNN